jgi:hypothetical protein
MAAIRVEAKICVKVIVGKRVGALQSAVQLHKLPTLWKERRLLLSGIFLPDWMPDHAHSPLILLESCMARTREIPIFQTALEAIVIARAPENQAAWLLSALPPQDGPLARGKFFGNYAGLGRRLQAASTLDADEVATLRAQGAPISEIYTLVDLARTVLLLRALSLLDCEGGVALFKEAFQKGDSGEQVSTLRALCFLPDPLDFLDAVIDATRTNVLQVFEAVANDNPYPAEHFPELNFNQLVMKALFMEVPLSRVVGLKSRVTPELSRMASDYASERSAAGRKVPADVALIVPELPNAG